MSSAHILEEGEAEKRIRGEKPSDEFYALEGTAGENGIIERLGGDDDWFRRSVEGNSSRRRILSGFAMIALAGITLILW